MDGGQGSIVKVLDDKVALKLLRGEFGSEIQTLTCLPGFQSFFWLGDDCVLLY